MSQEKVDRYKKEKKNRGKVMKRRKIRKTLIAVILTIVIAVGIGALIGVPLGKHIYKSQKAKEKANSVIAADDYNSWFNFLWTEQYYDTFAEMGLVSATEGDAE